MYAGVWDISDESCAHALEEDFTPLLFNSCSGLEQLSLKLC